MLPKLARPCPYLDRLDSVVENGFCSMCRRDVVDLSHMDEGSRDAFIVASGGKTCISFTEFVRPAVAAAAIAASAAVLAVPEAALAQSATVSKHAHKSRAASQRTPLVLPPVVIRTAGVPVAPPMPDKADTGSKPRDSSN